MCFLFRVQKGREYSHWIDLALRIRFKLDIPESCRPKVRKISKSRLLSDLGQFGEDTFWIIPPGLRQGPGPGSMLGLGRGPGRDGVQANAGTVSGPRLGRGPEAAAR